MSSDGPVLMEDPLLPVETVGATGREVGTGLSEAVGEVLGEAFGFWGTEGITD